MRTFLLLLSLAVGVFGVAGCHGGPSPTAFCAQYEEGVCARAYECYDASTKASQAFVDQFGVTQTECAAKLKAKYCGFVTDSHPCTSDTMRYHSDKADACLVDLKAASCQAFTSDPSVSSNCDNICS
jgi:hypothetical protein